METESRTEPAVPRPAAPLGPARGALISRFIVVDRIGAGGMGLVLSAYDTALERKVAIKLLRPDVGGASHEVRTARLLREAQAMARVSHRNVITVHEVGTFDDQVFIAMELVDGQPLSAWLARRRAWPEIRDVFLQAGRGLEAAHARGLVHRDFKPDNVLVGRDGRVRVTDFGVVAVATSAESAPPVGADLSRPGLVVGTPAYMAPEQHAGQRVDARADQFAFCLSLHEALTGVRPPAGAEVTDARIPRWLRPILARGLAARPEERHPSMTALLAVLERGPIVTGRRLAVAGVAVAAVAALGVMMRPQADPCRGFERHLAGVWDAPRRAAIAAALPAVAPAITGRFDAYAEAWVARRREVCEATFVRHEQSSDRLDVRMACLDGRLRELGALAAELPGAEAATALGAAIQLTDLSSCDDLIPPLPHDPAQRAAALAADAAVDRARALQSLERVREARETLEAAVPRLAEASYPPVEGRLLTLLGAIQGDLGVPGAGRPLLARGTAAAEAGRDDRTVAFGLRQLAWLSAQEVQYAQAHGLMALARAALARAGGDPAAEIALMKLEGSIYSSEGKHDEAIELARAALERSEKAFGSGAFETASPLTALALALGEGGHLDEAMATDQRAIALYERTLGRDVPVVSRLLSEQGNILARQGRFEQALVVYREALALKERVLGPDAPSTANTLQNIANALIGMRRFDEARPYLTRSIATWEKQYGVDAPILAGAVIILGQLELYSANPAAAVPVLERGIALAERDSGVQLDVDVTRCQLRLARALRGRPRADAVAAGELLFASTGPKDEIARCERLLASH